MTRARKHRQPAKVEAAVCPNWCGTDKGVGKVFATRATDGQWTDFKTPECQDAGRCLNPASPSPPAVSPVQKQINEAFARGVAALTPEQREAAGIDPPATAVAPPPADSAVSGAPFGPRQLAENWEWLAPPRLECCFHAGVFAVLKKRTVCMCGPCAVDAGALGVNLPPAPPASADERKDQP